jgi:putative transposase
MFLNCTAPNATKCLAQKINIAGAIYNHLIALHRRYHQRFGRWISAYRLKNYITKLKKTKRFSFWNSLGSQAI